MIHNVYKPMCLLYLTIKRVKKMDITMFLEYDYIVTVRTIKSKDDTSFPILRISKGSETITIYFDDTKQLDTFVQKLCSAVVEGNKPE